MSTTSKFTSSTEFLGALILKFNDGKQWTRGELESRCDDEAPSYCLLGAVRAIMGNSRAHEEGILRFMKKDSVAAPVMEALIESIPKCAGSRLALWAVNDRMSSWKAIKEWLLAARLKLAKVAKMEFKPTGRRVKEPASPKQEDAHVREHSKVATGSH